MSDETCDADDAWSETVDDGADQRCRNQAAELHDREADKEVASRPAGPGAYRSGKQVLRAEGDGEDPAGIAQNTGDQGVPPALEFPVQNPSATITPSRD